MARLLQCALQLRPAQPAHRVQRLQGQADPAIEQRDIEVDVLQQPVDRQAMHIVLAYPLRHLLLILILTRHHPDGADGLACAQADQYIARLDPAHEAVQRAAVVAAQLQRRIGQIGLIQVAGSTPADTRLALLKTVTPGATITAGLLDGDFPDGRIILQSQLFTHLRVADRILAELDKHALRHVITQCRAGVFLAAWRQGAQSLDEILVAKALVESYKAHAFLLHQLAETLVALFPPVQQSRWLDDFQCGIDGFVGLAGAGRAEQDLVQRNAGSLSRRLASRLHLHLAERIQLIDLAKVFQCRQVSQLDGYGWVPQRQ